MARISIKGLKISEALCLVRLHAEFRGSGLLPAFCNLLAGSQINMPFLSVEYQAGGIQAICCVDATHQALLTRLLSAEPMLQERTRYTSGVGLLTLFPHQSRLKLFGRSLRALAQADLRVFAMASSVGALTYVLDYARIDKAAAVMQACFELAENHAPFKAEFAVAQGTQRRPPGRKE
jgi:aspartokinase